MKKLYKVNLYQLLKDGDPSNNRCEAHSLGKIIVSASKNGGTNFIRRIGKCREVTEEFIVFAVDCSTTSSYDSFFDERVTKFFLPYEYDYWNKPNLYIVLASDLNDSNLVTEEDIKAYDPQNEVWYEILKKIQENGVYFDYKKEAMKKVYGKKILSRGKENE